MIINIVRWEPFKEIVGLRDAMDRLFEDSFVRAPRLWPRLVEWELPIDMYQTDDDVVMKAAIPEFKPEEVDISITDDTLTVKGEHEEEQEDKEENYFYKEHRHGAFTRPVFIPVKVKRQCRSGLRKWRPHSNPPQGQRGPTGQIKVKATQIAEGKKTEAKS